MNQISCLIIDDEHEARDGLRMLLSQDPEINILGSCQDGLEAIEQIQKQRPDLIFLDIQMPGVDGFEVLASIEKPWPMVVFVTAYDTYALKAFEVHALDYLLKPYSDERLFNCLNNVKQNVGTGKKSLEHIVAERQVSSDKKLIHDEDYSRITIKSEGRIVFLPKTEIIWIEGYDYYVKIHLSDRFYLLRETLKKLNDRLGQGYFRAHRSALINLDQVLELDKTQSNDYALKMKGGHTVKVSRNQKKPLVNLLNKRSD